MHFCGYVGQDAQKCLEYHKRKNENKIYQVDCVNNCRKCDKAKKLATKKNKNKKRRNANKSA